VCTVGLGQGRVAESSYLSGCLAFTTSSINSSWESWNYNGGYTSPWRVGGFGAGRIGRIFASLQGFLDDVIALGAMAAVAADIQHFSQASRDWSITVENMIYHIALFF